MERGGEGGGHPRRLVLTNEPFDSERQLVAASLELEFFGHPGSFAVAASCGHRFRTVSFFTWKMCPAHTPAPHDSTTTNRPVRSARRGRQRPELRCGVQDACLWKATPNGECVS